MPRSCKIQRWCIENAISKNVESTMSFNKTRYLSTICWIVKMGRRSSREENKFEHKFWTQILNRKCYVENCGVFNFRFRNSFLFGTPTGAAVSFARPSTHCVSLPSLFTFRYPFPFHVYNILKGLNMCFERSSLPYSFFSSRVRLHVFYGSADSPKG